MGVLKRLAIVVFLLGMAFGARAQEAAAPAAPEASQSQALEELITVIENEDSRTQLLERLRELAATPDAEEPAADAPEAAPEQAAPAEAAPTEPAAGEEGAVQPGLVDALADWSQDIIVSLPTTTFGVPIDQKAQQASAQVASRLQAGIEGGQLLRFLLWAVPGLLLVVGAGIATRRLGRGLVAPSVPVHKRRLAMGLVLKLCGTVVLFVAIASVFPLFAPSEISVRVFLTLSVGILLAMGLADLAVSALSSLTGLRGLRLVRYCQRRFYPWFVAIAHVALFAGLSIDPVLRRVIGWSAVDFGGFGLNMLAAGLVTVFVYRHKRAIGRLVFGGAARSPRSDNGLQNATRWLAKRWSLLAYGFLALSIVSLVTGQRNNDVLSQMLWSFGVVLVGLVLAPVLHRLFTLRSPNQLRARHGVRKVVIQNIFRLARMASDGVIIVAAGMIIARIWGFNLWGWILHDGQAITGPVLAAATCVVVAWLIWVVLDAWIAATLTPSDAMGWSRQRSSRVQTLLPLLRNGAMVLLIVLTGIAVLANLGVDVTPLIAGAGVFGLALSFGSQQLVQDVITGIFILAEDTIAIGDTISTGDRSGVVESISLRTVRLRDGDGALHSIPFSTIKALKNSSRNFGVMRPRYAVPSTVDPELVMEAMRETAKALREDPRYAHAVKGDIVDLGIDEINAGSVVVSGSLRTTPSRQAELGRAFNGKLLSHLAEKDVVL